MKRNALGLALLVFLMGCGQTPTVSQDAQIRTAQLAGQALAGNWLAAPSHLISIDASGSVQASGCSDLVQLSGVQEATGCAPGSSCMSAQSSVMEALARASGCLHGETAGPCLFQIQGETLTISCETRIGTTETLTYQRQ